MRSKGGKFEDNVDKRGSEVEVRREVARRGRGASIQFRLARSGFKSMETITELQPELVTSPSHFRTYRSVRRKSLM